VGEVVRCVSWKTCVQYTALVVRASCHAMRDALLGTALGMVVPPGSHVIGLLPLAVALELQVARARASASGHVVSS